MQNYKSPSALVRLALVITGILATIIAMVGIILPGLPATPFLLIALWAFARSSERLYGWLERIPLLKGALTEAHRFEEKRAIRPAIKILAVTMSWLSVVISSLTFGLERPIVLAVICIAATAATISMWVIPTDRS